MSARAREETMREAGSDPRARRREYIRMLEERNRLKQRLAGAAASKQQKKDAAREKGARPPKEPPRALPSD